MLRRRLWDSSWLSQEPRDTSLFRDASHYHVTISVPYEWRHVAESFRVVGILFGFKLLYKQSPYFELPG